MVACFQNVDHVLILYCDSVNHYFLYSLLVSVTLGLEIVNELFNFVFVAFVNDTLDKVKCAAMSNDGLKI